MSIVRIEQIYLNTDQTFTQETFTDPDTDKEATRWVTDPNTDSAKAIQWLADNGITDYVNLNYANSAVHQDCFTPLNTWYFSNHENHTFTAFPFLYYIEVHDDKPANQMPMILHYGLDEIENSNLAELYQLGK